MTTIQAESDELIGDGVYEVAREWGVQGFVALPPALPRRACNHQ